MFKLAGAFALLLLVSSVLAQGGQGGAGGGPAGGFGGGGFQGGGGDFNTDAEEFRKTLFLSPGDRTEWVFEAKTDDTILVKVTSQVFDPAVAVTDEKGAKLQENDDIEPGNQMAQLLFVAPRNGTYKVVVTNYKGTAGGPFEFYARRFHSLELKLGSPVLLMHDEKRVWGRVQIEKPGDYTVTVKGDVSRYSLLIMAPNAEPAPTQFVDMDRTYQRHRFHASAPGWYFLNTPTVAKPSVKVAPIAEKTAAIGSSTSAPLAADEIQNWSIPVKRGDLVEVALMGNPDLLLLDIRNSRDRENRVTYTMLDQPDKAQRYVLGVTTDGTLEFSVRSMNGRETSAEFKVSPVGKSLPLGAVTSNLNWFESEYWIFEGKPGDVIKLDAHSDIYTTEMTLMLPNGSTMDAAQVGRTADVTLSASVQEGGKHVVKVSGGGVGAYRLNMQVIPPKRLAMGDNTGTASGAGPEVWRFTAVAGGDYLVRGTPKGARLSVTVLDPSGRFAGSLSLNGTPGADLIRIKAATAGEYTVVVRTEEDSGGEYTLKLFNLDK